MKTPHTLIFTRSGDFYEAFGADARTVAENMDIALTMRKGVVSVGFPAHKLHAWTGLLANRGFRVEINIYPDPEK